MSITGNLNTMELGELLQWLGHTGKTGTLVLSNGAVEKRVVFRNGEVIVTASSDPKEYLGHFLVSHGLIDELTLAKAMDMQEKNSMLLGKILVTIGALTESQLEHMLRLKLEESVYEIFTWQEGEFRFVDGELAADRLIPLRFNVNALVLEGSRRADEWHSIRARIPSKDCVVVSTRPLTSSGADALTSKILSLVNDDRTLEEIALHAHASEFQVCRTLLGQIEDGAVKVVRPRQSGPAEPQPSAAEALPDANSLIGKAEALLETGDYEQALGHFRAALNLHPKNEEIRQRTAQVESDVTRHLSDEGIRPEAVPTLLRSMEDLAALDIAPQDGFILSRVNGTYDIQTILKISPMAAIDALLVFRRLLRERHIKLAG